MEEHRPQPRIARLEAPDHRVPRADRREPSAVHVEREDAGDLIAHPFRVRLTVGLDDDATPLLYHVGADGAFGAVHLVGDEGEPQDGLLSALVGGGRKAFQKADACRQRIVAASVDLVPASRRRHFSHEEPPERGGASLAADERPQDDCDAGEKHERQQDADDDQTGARGGAEVAHVNGVIGLNAFRRAARHDQPLGPLGRHRRSLRSVSIAARLIHQGRRLRFGRALRPVWPARWARSRRGRATAASGG